MHHLDYGGSCRNCSGRVSVLQMTATCCRVCTRPSPVTLNDARRQTVPCVLCVSVVQDTIPRGGKLISAYKRNGQRVIVNKIGDIVVSMSVGSGHNPATGSYIGWRTRNDMIPCNSRCLCIAHHCGDVAQ
jgi:hypothetical protein